MKEQDRQQIVPHKHFHSSSHFPRFRSSTMLDRRTAFQYSATGCLESNIHGDMVAALILGRASEHFPKDGLRGTLLRKPQRCSESKTTPKCFFLHCFLYATGRHSEKVRQPSRLQLKSTSKALVRISSSLSRCNILGSEREHARQGSSSRTIYMQLMLCVSTRLMNQLYTV